jgi:hypothetical protein
MDDSRQPSSVGRTHGIDLACLRDRHPSPFKRRKRRIETRHLARVDDFNHA